MLLRGVKTSSKNDVSFDSRTSFFHFLDQRRISNDARCVSDILADFVQSLDTSHYYAFLCVCQFCNMTLRIVKFVQFYTSQFSRTPINIVNWCAFSSEQSYRKNLSFKAFIFTTKMPIYFKDV